MVAEGIDSFRTKIRQWLAANMADSQMPAATGPDRVPQRHRLLQRRIFDGGLAGLTYPTAYGGQGLSADFQKVFNEEAAGYEMPTLFNVSLGILGPTILDFGTEEQKRRHIPAILAGEELWVQLLSEPSGGSDLAGCLTRATHDGDHWILQGSKIWSTGADYSDYALCLVRTDWTVPKHRGLTMFALRLHQPGIEIAPVRQANQEAEFCQEFITDLKVGDGAILGQVNGGWEVAGRLLSHERNLAGAASPYTYGFDAEGTPVAPTPEEMIGMVRRSGRQSDPALRALVAEAHSLQTIQAQLVERIGTGIRCGELEPTAGSLLRLFEITKVLQWSDASLEVAATGLAVWAENESGRAGSQFLMRQACALAGGSTEMQRNIIAERLLGLPREHAPDAGVPFDQVRHNSPGPR